MTDQPRQSPQPNGSGFFGKSILHRIIFALSLFVIVIGIISAIAVQRVVLRGLQLSAEDKVSQVTERIVGLIETARIYTQSDALQSALRINEEAPDEAAAIIEESLLQFIQTSGGEALSVVLVDSEGNVVAAAPEIEAVTVEEVRGQPWYMATLAGETYLANNLEMAIVSDIDGFHVAVPVLDIETNERIASFYVIFANSSTAQPPEVIGISSVGTEPARREFAVYARSGEAIIPGLTQEIQAETFRALAAGVISESSGGRLYAAVPLFNFGGATLLPNSAEDWILIAAEPATFSRGSVTTPATLLQLFIALQTGLVIVALVIVVNIFSTPLRALAQTALRIQRQSAYNVLINVPDEPNLQPVVEIYNQAVALKQNQQDQIAAAVQVSEQGIATDDMTSTLERLIGLIYERFGFQAVRCYLTDNAQSSARLVSAQGVDSEELMQTGHIVAINDSTLVGQAIFLRYWQQGIITEYRDAGIAVPMMLSNQVLGALLFVYDAGISPDQIPLLQLLTNQTAIIIENARLLRRNAATLEQIEALNRRLTREGWEKYLGSENVIRHTLDPFQRWPAIPSEILGQSERLQAQTYTDDEGRRVIAVPLILRDEAVGSISATRPPGAIWTREEISLIESVAARMVVIADSIRLVDEVSRRAAREELVNDLSAQILSRSASVESVLQTALSELGNSLGSDRIALRIGGPADAANVPAKNEDDIENEADEHHPPSMNGGGA